MVATTVSANPLKLDLWSHIKCLAICFIVTVATFQYGLDYALVGGFMAMPGFLEVYGYYDAETQKWAIDPTVQQLISSLMTIGTFVGSLLVGPFSVKLGRKYGLWAASLLNAVATAIMLGTTSVGALYFARLLLGQTAKLLSMCLADDYRHLSRLVSYLLTSLYPRSYACSSPRHRLCSLSVPAVYRLYRGC